MYTAVVATDKNGGIGKDNKIPWKLNKDLRFFRKITQVYPKYKINAVIMGRKTFESINKIPLEHRINIVLTTQENYKVTEGILKFSSLEAAITHAANNIPNIHNIFIIGGQEVYQYGVINNIIGDIYKTVIDKDYNCDKFFPDITDTHYMSEIVLEDSENMIDFKVELWKRK